jgi:hypothetical protein
MGSSVIVVAPIRANFSVDVGDFVTHERFDTLMPLDF